MELRWLQDFLVLGETGNFTRAAHERHLSQAAFSRHIQQLESWLGVKLVDRGAFPTRLTAEGVQFRERAGEILRRAMQARSEANGAGQPTRVRIGIPNLLAATRLPSWWKAWSGSDSSSCALELGNVHDIATSFVAGAVDLLICFHSAQHPIQLDAKRFERVVIARDRLRPVVHRDLMDEIGWPGSVERPVPLLMHTPNVYFGQLVTMVIDAAPARLHGTCVAECEMTEVLRAMALAGHGVTWLTESSLTSSACRWLVPLGGDDWTADLSVVAFRHRFSRASPVLERVWSRIAACDRSDAPPATTAKRSQAITLED